MEQIKGSYALYIAPSFESYEETRHTLHLYIPGKKVSHRFLDPL